MMPRRVGPQMAFNSAICRTLPLYVRDMGSVTSMFIDCFLISIFVGLELTGVYTLFWSVAHVVHSLAVHGLHRRETSLRSKRSNGVSRSRPTLAANRGQCLWVRAACAASRPRHRHHSVGQSGGLGGFESRAAWQQTVQDHLQENFGLRERNLFPNVVLIQPLSKTAASIKSTIASGRWSRSSSRRLATRSFATATSRPSGAPKIASP
jgi:hypothetical protein